MVQYAECAEQKPNTPGSIPSYTAHCHHVFDAMPPPPPPYQTRWGRRGYPTQGQHTRTGAAPPRKPSTHPESKTSHQRRGESHFWMSRHQAEPVVAMVKADMLSRAASVGCICPAETTLPNVNSTSRHRQLEHLLANCRRSSCP